MLSHPQVEVAAISSVSFEGQPISQTYPSLSHRCDALLASDQDVIRACDVVFASLPHGHSEPMPKPAWHRARRLSTSERIFVCITKQTIPPGTAFPTKTRPCINKPFMPCPELYREKIKKARLLGNPGCYPTSIALGLAPVLCSHLIDPNTLVLDSKSGVTGAGRGLSQNTHYPDCNEAFAPYKIANHRHTPEIEQTLSDLSGQAVKVTFVPHLLPVNRGIVSTMYAQLTQDRSLDEIHQAYLSFYQNEPFVRVRPLGEIVNLKHVKYANYCDISLHLDPRTHRLIVVSAIDNMVKGAAGQAIQNMNLLCGFEETEGLTMVPPAF